MSDTRHPRPPKRPEGIGDAPAIKELKARQRLWSSLADVSDRVVTLLDLMIAKEREDRG